MSTQQQSPAFKGLITLAIIIAIIIAFLSPFTGLIAVAIIIALLAFQRRIEKLRTAALLVTLGTMGLLEHPSFSIIFALRLNVVPVIYVNDFDTYQGEVARGVASRASGGFVGAGRGVASGSDGRRG